MNRSASRKSPDASPSLPIYSPILTEYRHKGYSANGYFANPARDEEGRAATFASQRTEGPPLPSETFAFIFLASRGRYPLARVTSLTEGFPERKSGKFGSRANLSRHIPLSRSPFVRPPFVRINCSTGASFGLPVGASTTFPAEFTDFCLHKLFSRSPAGILLLRLAPPRLRGSSCLPVIIFRKTHVLPMIERDVDRFLRPGGWDVLDITGMSQASPTDDIVTDNVVLVMEALPCAENHVARSMR